MALSGCGPGLIRSRPCPLPLTLSCTRTGARLSSARFRAAPPDPHAVLPLVRFSVTTCWSYRPQCLADGAGGLLDTRNDLLHRVGCAVG